MTRTDPNTPIIVGVGQVSEKLDGPDYAAMSPVQLAAAAGRAALEDALGYEQLRAEVDAIATTRTFEDSGVVPAPFGKSDKFPRSIARDIGIAPRTAILETSSGDSPQRMVAEFCQRIGEGDFRMVLLAGAEATSTLRHLTSQDQHADWSDAPEGDMEDRGPGIVMHRYQSAQRIAGAPPAFAMLENARRARMGLSREDYASDMGRLFAPFSRVAEANPLAAAPIGYSPEELATVDGRNRMIADPFSRLIIARDQVNQGAALLLTSVGVAQELGIPEDKWVYLHGHCAARDLPLHRRPDLGASQAARMATQEAMDTAGVGVDDIGHFDFYSCFPIAVENVAIDYLGLSPDDPRGLTVTGGLPFFGGPGNNYSMHAIATMTERLRADPGSYGLVAANGGFLLKYAVGVYSTTPSPRRRFDSRRVQSAVNRQPAVELTHEPEGWGTIETYTVVYGRGEPKYAIVIGRLDADNSRFVANDIAEDPATLARMVAEDPIGQRIYVHNTSLGNRFSFSLDAVQEHYPPAPKALRDDYAFTKVERDGHLLIVTINRPEARNCISPPAHLEMEEIWDAFEADPDLWVAIVTGAGEAAFCTGMDIKYAAQGKPMYQPKSGFGGLCKRTLTKPVIAAVNGFALGGGMELCLACDLVVADEGATFALREARIGVLAASGGVIRLPRQIPPKVANELLFTGRALTPEEARSWGLVNRIAPKGQALEAARDLAADILQSSPASIRATIKMRNESKRFASDNEAMTHYYDVVDEVLCSEDMKEGTRAFAEKRQPRWTNR